MDPSIQCQICGIIAKRNLKHYKHYEAVCCLGCKAFFRRYVRGINQTALECKGGGNCDLSVGRTACKECRFRKCLEVGMDDSKVLNEDDRKKYTHPKKKTKSGENTTQSPPNHQQNCPNCENCPHCESYPNCLHCPRVQNEQNIPVQENMSSGSQLVIRRISSPGGQALPCTSDAHLAKRRISIPGLQPDQDVPSTSGAILTQRWPRTTDAQHSQNMPSSSNTQLAKHRKMSAQLAQPASVPIALRQPGLQQTQVCPKRSISPDYGPKKSPRNPEPSTSCELQLTTIQDSKPASIQRSVPDLIQEVQNIFYEILAKVNHPPFLIDHFIAGHAGSWKSSHSQAFLQLIDINVPIMYHFANQNPLFKELNPVDQKLLLNCNAHLFREYVMARYMVADTTIDQLGWILGPNAPMGVGMLALTDLSPVNFEDLNGQGQGMIIPNLNPKSLVSFKECLKMITQYFQYPKYHSPLIANLFLFTTTQWKQKELDKLIAPEQIQSFEAKAKEMVQYGSQEIGDEIGTAYLNQLVDTLHHMHSLKKWKVDLTSPYVTECQYSVLSEKSLIKNLVCQFEKLNIELAGDGKYAEMLTGFLLYNISHFEKLVMFQSFNLVYNRCVALLKRVCSIDQPRLPPQVITQAFFLQGVKSESFPTYLEKLKWLSGIQDLGALEETLKGIKNPFSMDQPAFKSWIAPYHLKKAKRCHHSVSQFLKNTDVFVLVLLEFLLKHQPEYQDWHRSVIRILMKRIKDYCVIDGSIDVQSIYSDFCHDLDVVCMTHQKMAIEGGHGS